MKIKHRYSFRDTKENSELKEFLELNHIRYKISTGIPIISVEVYENAKYWNELNELMLEHGKTSLIEKEFTKSELQEAEWLTIRSNWRKDYPQPEDNDLYKAITYNNQNYCDKCGCGLEQKDVFYLKRAPNWKNKNFLMVYWIEDELFVSDNVVNQIMKKDIKGTEIYPVRKYRTNEELSNIKQLKVETILDKGLIIEQDELDLEIVCDKCKQVKYILKNRKVLKHKKVCFKNSPDIVKTFEIFGSGLIAARKIIISKKFADMIFNNGWANNVILEPIELV